MHTISPLIVLLLLCLIAPSFGSAGGSSGDLIWTNENTDPPLNSPDYPTYVSFNESVQILSISMYHGNYGKGDTPGSITLFHKDGTTYGPWGAVGAEGKDGTPNVYWISQPGEVIKAGTYIISDTKPETWSQNEASGYTGMAKITYMPAGSDEEEAITPITPHSPVTPVPTISEPEKEELTGRPDNCTSLSYDEILPFLNDPFNSISNYYWGPPAELKAGVYEIWYKPGLQEHTSTLNDSQTSDSDDISWRFVDLVTFTRGMEYTMEMNGDQLLKVSPGEVIPPKDCGDADPEECPAQPEVKVFINQNDPAKSGYQVSAVSCTNQRK